MNIPYETTGRTRQKTRTRGALLHAARELLRDGQTPTVEQAAERAEVSRTTAYRYFPTQHDLLAAIHPQMDARSLLGDDAPADPEQRLDRVLDSIAEQLLENRHEFRAALRASLTPGVDRAQLVLRQGRAIGWIEDALRPLRATVPRRELRRLTLAIRAVFGIEALVWLTEVAQLRAAEAVSVMRWSAKTLFQATVADASRATRRGRRGGR